MYMYNMMKYSYVIKILVLQEIIYHHVVLLFSCKAVPPNFKKNLTPFEFYFFKLCLVLQKKERNLILNYELNSCETFIADWK